MCEKCQQSDPELIEYNFYLQNFNIFDINAAYDSFKKYNGCVYFNSKQFHWTWNYSCSLIEVDSFFKSLKGNDICFCNDNISSIFLSQYHFDVNIVDHHDYVREFILSNNVYDLCIPLYHRFIRKSKKNSIDHYRSKRRHFLHCSAYIVFALFHIL